tara:strand:- start:71 stop:412 length:342 start_codon:yes stop_codon:yes gene_type:complete
MTETNTQSFSIVITTVDSIEQAEKISNYLVQNNIAACINIIGPYFSIYKWKNKLVQDKEIILWIKTLTDNILSVTNTIKSLHSYDVPEIISFRFRSHNDDYSQWICDTFSKKV